MKFVYKFLYNSSCCESAASTLSIHKTRKGAEEAMVEHKAKILAEYDMYDDEYKEDFSWDFDQWWNVDKVELKK